MKLLDIVIKLIFLSPCRCGRTFYQCDVTEQSDSISLKFIPSDKFLSLDPRREDEAYMPTHFHEFEKWQHIGLVVGNIEHFLITENIKYTVEKNTDAVVEMTVHSKNSDISADLKLYQIFKHAHRSFDISQSVDGGTQEILSEKINQFLQGNTGHKVMINDQSIIKKLHALAIYWDLMGEKNGYVKAPQMKSSLVITVPPAQFDLNYYFKMGRLYADLGLTALARGYQVGFVNVFNYLDPRVRRVQDVLKLNFDEYTLENVVPRSFLCIGKALDSSKPFNWVADKNNYTDGALPSCILVTKDFVTVESMEEKVV